jgi:hypothetical protein
MNTAYIENPLKHFTDTINFRLATGLTSPPGIYPGEIGSGRI